MDVKKICVLLLCLMMLMPASISAHGDGLTVTVEPHRALLSFYLPDREAVLVTYKTALDNGEMMLYGQNGQFEAVCELPGTDKALKLNIIVYSLGGKVLLKQDTLSVAVTDEGPVPGLSYQGRPAGSAREAVITAEPDGIYYRFTTPGRDTVVIKCKSPQESHTVTIYAGEDYWYEGVVAMPYTYADDRITVMVTTPTTSTLYSGEFQMPTSFPPVAEQAAEGRLKGVKVCIDPGHQAQTKVETVQSGPNMNKWTTTTVGMAKGVVTNRRESIVVLETAMRLRNALLAEGADVLMTRESQDQFVGMLERAEIPNEWGADFVLRLHCNNRSNASIQGIHIFCPYSSEYAKEVADVDTYSEMGFTLLRAMEAVTGAPAGKCTLNDTYVGNNWSKMPSFLVEMGYMSNKEEDLLMANAPYQEKLAEGMVEGIVQLARMRGLIE